ncbi:hypothetical protein PVK06_028180 [Gossypium arboreum]|uniref:Disease resistance N-terminal domain-containing protein n=1 Tax=Gossypium arboreum TaxID=29729 RepID=A0ABR0P450_GOSAR|nr:hypothetical protein PVK06_028180 [Gossypium arboreum]
MSAPSYAPVSNIVFEEWLSPRPFFMRFADKDKFSSYLKKWQTLLLIINASLENAEGKQTSSRLLELWLSDLRDVAYDAEDIIDELTTEARRRQITEDPDAASPTCKVGRYFQLAFFV